MSELWIPERETEEDELAAIVLRAGYLETALVPDTFSDIADYVDEYPERTRAERVRRWRASGAAMRARTMLGPGPGPNLNGAASASSPRATSGRRDAASSLSTVLQAGVSQGASALPARRQPAERHVHVSRLPLPAPTWFGAVHCKPTERRTHGGRASATHAPRSVTQRSERMAKAKCKGFLADEHGRVGQVDGFSHNVLFEVRSVNLETGEVMLRAIDFLDADKIDVPDVGAVVEVEWFEALSLAVVR